MAVTKFSKSKCGAKTKARLLKSASSIFSEKGFRDTTIAEICGLASANVAAVNYHFGDKIALYKCAFEYAWQCANEIYPLDVLDDVELSPKERLYGFISAILHRGFSDGEGGWISSFLKHEFSDPTDLQQEIFQNIMGPVRKKVFLVVAALLDGGDPEATRFCMYSLMSQCLHIKVNPFLQRYLELDGMDEDAKVDGLANHILRFTLAGINDRRETV